MTDDPVGHEAAVGRRLRQDGRHRHTSRYPEHNLQLPSDPGNPVRRNPSNGINVYLTVSVATPRVGVEYSITGATSGWNSCMNVCPYMACGPP